MSDLFFLLGARTEEMDAIEEILLRIRAGIGYGYLIDNKGYRISANQTTKIVKTIREVPKYRQEWYDVKNYLVSDQKMFFDSEIIDFNPASTPECFFLKTRLGQVINLLTINEHLMEFEWETLDKTCDATGVFWDDELSCWGIAYNCCDCEVRQKIPLRYVRIAANVFKKEAMISVEKNQIGW